MSAATNPASVPQPSAERGNEPSMEEILASIRRIIADDQALPLTQREAAAPKPDKVSEPVRSEGRRPPQMPPAPAVREPASEMPRGPARPAASPPAAVPQPAGEKVDSDFEEWLSETAAGASKALEAGPRAASAAVQPAAAVRDRAPAVRPVPQQHLPKEPEKVPRPAAPADEAADDWSAIDTDTDRDTGFEDAPRFSVVEGGADHSAGDEDDDDTVDDELERPVVSALEALTRDLPGGSDGLLSDTASESVSSSFQALSQSVMLQHSAVIEQSIREMLRPMLKQWLDDNLPTMVERLVRAEIERVARGGS